MRTRSLFCGAIAAVACSSASAEMPATALEPIQVTATRTEAAVAEVPALMSVISGEDIRARGARTLHDALAGLAGIEISPGGDAGPAGSVPAFMGLREFDAFLLVVDGVPAGGAFNPALTTLDMSSVERIEVLRGSAPVMYGATSFVGVIHVIHYAAGEAPGQAQIGFGGPTDNTGSFDGEVSTSWGRDGGWQHSLTANGERRNLADEDAGLDRGHLLYRLGGTIGGGQAHMDLDVSRVSQDPDSPVIREGSQLTDKTPLDANHNPADASITEKRIQLNGGYQTQLGAARWNTLASAAFTEADTLRGYLADANTGDAVGYEQDRKVTDVYLDSHLAWTLGDGIDIATGVDALIGKAKQETAVFSYTVNPDGTDRPDSATGTKLKEGEGESERAFLGLYSQLSWQVASNVDLLAGLRLNSTDEKRDGEREQDTNGDGVNEEVMAEDKDSNLRLSGMLGANWRIWNAAGNLVTLFADYRDTFKPAAYEFGPENEADIPKAETAKTVEAGVKTAFLGGDLNVEAAWFRQDFKNVFLQEGHDIRETRLQGAELEARLALAENLQLRGSMAYHDAQVIEGTIDDGAIDVSGKRLEMSPSQLASLALIYNPARGLFAAAGYNHTGERFLNSRNSAEVGAYDTFDATLGYRWANWTANLTGHNLTDRRDVVSAGEFSEVLTGTSAYYRLPARDVMLTVNYRFGADKV